MKDSKNLYGFKILPHHYTNGIIGIILIAYIIYINVIHHENDTKQLTELAKFFGNPFVSFIILGAIAFFALDVTPHCGFACALLLTIAFLNTKMILSHRVVNEGFHSQNYSHDPDGDCCRCADRHNTMNTPLGGDQCEHSCRRAMEMTNTPPAENLNKFCENVYYNK